MHRKMCKAKVFNGSYHKNAQEIVHKNIKCTKTCAQSRLQGAYVKCKRKEMIFLDGEVFFLLPARCPFGGLAL
jgi:hypothetical protein